MSSTNAFLKNATYSQGKSTSKEEKLEKIRTTKRVEPKDTGANHPTNIYIPLGHGKEYVSEKCIVPKGCILVVKAHSGDTTEDTDFINNTNAILNIDNKEFVFDPVSYKKELYSLLNSNDQAKKKNITASSSIAIYREGDTYNDFLYEMVNMMGNGNLEYVLINDSGIYKLMYETPPVEDNRGGLFAKGNTAILDFNDERQFLDEIALLDKKIEYDQDIKQIAPLFKYSTAYEYYYTEAHIEDILTYIIYLHKEGVDITEKTTLQKKIKKGNVNHITILMFLKGKPKTIKNLIKLIIYMTTVTQDTLFEDVKSGLIKPGIFYNLICRDTAHTLSPDKSDPMTKKTTGNYLLNEKYIENSNHDIKVHNQVDEIKNRISEAILQRKNQARQVFNEKSKKYSNNTYKKNLNNLQEAKNPNLKWNIRDIIGDIAALTVEGWNTKDNIEALIKKINECSEKYNLDIRQLVVNELHKKKLNASPDKLFKTEDIDKMFTRISNPDLGFSSISADKKTMFTNNYKKYRNETSKNYKKINKKWVENVPVTGGKRTTRRHR